jgi:hypothetical protein
MGSCVSKSEQVNAHPFVDLNKLVQDEIASKTAKFLVKESAWNGVEKVDTVFQPNWGKELSHFKKIPINPVNWSNEYEFADTVELRHEKWLRFQSIQPRNSLKTIDLLYRGADLKGFQLVFNSESKLKRQTKSLLMLFDDRYEIKGIQKTRFFEEENYIIVGKTITK